MCEYIFEDGTKCKEKPMPGSKYCVLHIPFPEDRNSKEFKRIAKLKEKKIKEKIKNNDFDFKETILPGFVFSNLKIQNGIFFDNASIFGNIRFIKSKIGNVSFVGAKINGDNDEAVAFAQSDISGSIYFTEATIKGITQFTDTAIKLNVLFNASKIKDKVYFINSTIEGAVLFNNNAIIEKGIWFENTELSSNVPDLADVQFKEAEIKGVVGLKEVTIKSDISFEQSTLEEAVFDNTLAKGKVLFDKAEVEGNILFRNTKVLDDLSFQGAKINKDIDFGVSIVEGKVLFDKVKVRGNISSQVLDIKGGLSLEDATFENIKAEENIYRLARRFYEGIGDREMADKYFYKEMKARREQKNKVTQLFEYLIADFTCKYGTDFLRPLWIWTTFVLVLFPAIFYLGKGIQLLNNKSAKSFLSAEYFSVVTATTLGYGDLRPALTTFFHIPIFRLLASFEAIFGTFMWVIFLTVFARKYMR